MVLVRTGLQVSAPRIEYGVQLGIGETWPRLSWTILSDVEGWRQERYEVAVWRNGSKQRTSIVRESAGQVFEEWPFTPLVSRDRIEVAVRVYGGGGSGVCYWSPWSERTTAEAGLILHADWSAAADFISPRSYGGMDGPAPIVFTRVEVKGAPVRARLYVTAKGLYEFSVNGVKVGADVLTPGWTAYQKRLRYQTYDITALLAGGGAGGGSRTRSYLLSAVLGNGWYRGQLVWPGNRSSYGDRLALLAQLELTFADGSSRTITTDRTWRACESGIMFDDLYDGQTRDLGVDNVDPESRPCEGVVVLEGGWPDLVAPTAPPVCVTETVAAVSCFLSPSGKLIFDFGQNLVGWVQATIRGGTAGDQARIRHAEVLENGELGIRPLRSAKATDTYLLKGGAGEVETLQPTFTFHGFRYAEITTIHKVELEHVRALVIGSKLRRTGWFTSSDPQLNQLHRNVVWSMRGNFLDIPTDCPARDERLGWTGDIQVFAPTANFLFNTSGFLSGWLSELAAEQKPDGGVPNIIPDVLRQADPSAAGWGDAAAVVPLSLFDAYSDRRVLERQYTSMAAWVRKVQHIAGPHCYLRGDECDQFGDWLDPTAPPDEPGNAQAHRGVVATAYLARSAHLVARAAKVLGHADDASQFEALHARVVDAFSHHYVSSSSSSGSVILSDCQTVYALAIVWGLLNKATARHASRRLAELVRAANYRVSTGFLGTPVILAALQAAGHADLAMRMLLQGEVPGWLYPVSMGATTIWERWDSMLPDGSINPGSMTSFNHYVYGAVADWMHEAVAGLAALEPGYRRIRVRPIDSLLLTSATARHESSYGMIEVSWTRNNDDGVFCLQVLIPVGVTAEVWMPGCCSNSPPIELTNGKHTIIKETRDSLTG
ncbi:alpha-L-rhamnosidase [Podospora didyma]|uniref:alpha-L-rhamnosidase n=1 Tax=Podospora didyma TaxID=330526 RepID=A0AAE0NCB5_9PEZI|nr:alpha-L-rhamnosidase [Podospora didyma]